MGHGNSKGRKTKAGGIGRGQNYWDWEETLGAARSPEGTPRPTECGGRRGAVRGSHVTMTRPPTEWEGESSRVRTTRLPTEWEGESSRLRTTRPPERQRDPRETKPREPSQCPHTDGGRMDGGGGGRGRKLTHRQSNQGARAKWQRRRGSMRQDGGAGRGDGDSNRRWRRGAPAEHFVGADGATTENGKPLRHEYDNVASEASERGPTSAGPAA